MNQKWVTFNTEEQLVFFLRLIIIIKKEIEGIC